MMQLDLNKNLDRKDENKKNCHMTMKNGKAQGVGLNGIRRSPENLFRCYYALGWGQKWSLFVPTK